MTLYFITGNKNKFKEVKDILGNVEQLDIDLPEIQDINPENIIKAKLKEALKHKKAEFIVEDTSLHLDCLNGLPGPLIKWFLEAIGRQGLADLAEKMQNSNAQAKATIGYAKGNDIKFFDGVIKGNIVDPRGESNFGWDPIFQPEGYSKTFAGMNKEEKNRISHRRLALNKLKEYIK